MSSVRDRILARRAQYVAAALAMAGCRAPAAPSSGPEPPPSTTPSALAGPPRPDAGPALDSDGDGIADEHDKCPTEPGTVLREGCPGVCLSIVPAYDVVIRAQIFFAKGSAAIRPEALPVLESIASALKEHADLSVWVRGHVDVGEPKALGTKRATAIRDWLVDHGVGAAMLTVTDAGAALPLDENDAAKNRRVDFIVR